MFQEEELFLSGRYVRPCSACIEEDIHSSVMHTCCPEIWRVPTKSKREVLASLWTWVLRRHRQLYTHAKPVWNSPETKQYSSILFWKSSDRSSGL